MEYHKRIPVDKADYQKFMDLTKDSESKTKIGRLRFLMREYEKLKSVPKRDIQTESSQKIDLSEDSIKAISIGVFNDLKTYLSGEFEKLKG